MHPPTHTHKHHTHTHTTHTHTHAPRTHTHTLTLALPAPRKCLQIRHRMVSLFMGPRGLMRTTSTAPTPNNRMLSTTTARSIGKDIISRIHRHEYRSYLTHSQTWIYVMSHAFTNIDIGLISRIHRHGYRSYPTHPQTWI